MNFPSQIFLNYIYHGYRAAILKINSLWLFYMAVATYFCNEKLHRTMRTAIASYLLKLSPTEKFTPLSTSLLSKKGPSKSVDLPWTRRGRHCYYFCYCHGFSFLISSFCWNHIEIDEADELEIYFLNFIITKHSNP